MNRFKHATAAILCGVIVAGTSYFNLLYRADNNAADAIYQTPTALDGKIVVLGIDERALAQIGPFQTWERSDMADIIDALNANPDALPAAIGIDIMYFGETDPASDQRLAQAAGRYGNVVVGSNINFTTDVTVSQDGTFRVDDFAVAGFEEPYDALKAVTRQGHVNTMPDLDGVMRSNIHTVTLPDGRVSSSFAYELYKLYAQKNGLPSKVTPPMNERNQWYIPYAAMPGNFSDGFSVVDVRNGDIPPELFADCIVLIGPYATGMMDAYTTAIDHTIPMHGVEIHANIVQALLNGRFKTHVSNWLQSVIVFLIVVAAYAAFRVLKPQASTPLAVGILAAYMGTAYLLGQKGYLLKIIYLPIAVTLLYFGWLSINYIREALERKKVTDTFKRYVAPTVVDELFKNKDKLKLGGEKKEIACMFVDIRGFTPMSEVLEPEQVVEILNQYLDLTSSAIFLHQGMLDKFIGDATMALYNAPLDLDDYIYRAVLTAWDIVKGGEALSERLLAQYGRTVSFGIGLNCGTAIVGNIGTDIHMDYTAIGDTVNTAARLESQARAGQVLLSESVYLAVKDRITAVPLGEIPLKGKAKGVVVYGLAQINEYAGTQEALDTANEAPGKGAVSYTA